MSDQLHKVAQGDLSRRQFLVGTAALAGGIALASAGNLALPQTQAFAASALADGTYKVNANLYMSKKVVVIGINAYFTNPTDPNAEETKDQRPSTPATGLNADLVVAGGVATVTVPLVNECFMLLSAADGKAVKVVSTETKTAIYNDTANQPLTRITKIGLQLADQNGAYELGATDSYAAYTNPPFPMSMFVPGHLTWQVSLAVDFSTATLV